MRLTALLLTIVTACSLNGQGRPELENLTFAEKRFESEAIGRETRYGVFLPKDYDAEENADKRYPLVIWLHGMWEDHQRFLVRGGGSVLDEMVGDGSMPECVFVCANGNRSSFWTNGAQKKSAYEDMVTQDLLKHVTENYRIAKERHLRAIAGVSMGGYGALKIALKKPGRFGAVAAHSAAILPQDPKRLLEEYPWLRGRGGPLIAAVFGDPIDVEKWKAENVMTLADGMTTETLEGLKIYFDCGSADRYQFDGPNVRLHEMLEDKKIPHTWRLVDGGGHGWRSGYNLSAVPHSLRFLASAFASKRATSALKGLTLPGGGKH